MSTSIKVVVADECVQYYNGIKQSLSAYSKIEVVAHAKNGDDLPGVVALHQPGILLMESRLRISEGNAVKKMQEQFPNVRKIIYTWHKSMRRVEIAFEANAYGYLLKNEETTIARLAECIHIVYDGGTHFCSLCTPILQAKLNGRKPHMFTPVELQIIPLMARGKTSREIGKLIFKSPLTVESYRKAMLKKTNTRKDTEFISWCYENEYLDR